MIFYFQDSETGWGPVFGEGKPEYLVLAAGTKLDLTFKFKSRTGADVTAPETSWVFGLGDEFGEPNRLLLRMTAVRAQDGTVTFTGTCLTKQIIGKLAISEQAETWAELAGISSSSTSPGTVIRWKVVLVNRITREGMLNPPTLTDGFLTDAQIRSLILNSGTGGDWSVTVLESTAISMAGKIYTKTLQDNDAFTFFTPGSGRDGRFYLYLTQPSAYVSFTLPTVIWDNGISPNFNQNGKLFLLFFHYVNGAWHGRYIPDISGYMVSPTGGTTGQVLKKTASGTAWEDDLKAEIVLGPCTALGLGTSSSGPVFSWSDPDNVTLNGAVLGEWNRTVLVRKTGTAYPASYSDGTIVAETSKSAGNKNYYHEHNFTDTTQETGVSYKYMLFSQTVAGAWNCLDGNKYTDGQGLSWSQVQGFVRAGRGAELFPVGTVFYVDHPEYTHTDGTGLWFRVAGHDQVPAQDESLTHTMCLEMVDCLFSTPYDNGEASYALTEDTVAIAGKVYYTLSGTTYTALVEGTDWNAGDPVPMASWYEANLSGRGSGSNNPVQNNQIQWLNSSGATGSWFTKQTIWDTCSTTLLNKNGFCKHLDPLFLAVVQPAKLTTALCNAEGGGSVTHYARFWSLSMTQIFGTANNGITENAQLSYYSNGGDPKKKLKDSSDYTTWWLRSALPLTANDVYYVQPSGASSHYGAFLAYGFSPACIIA